MRPGQRGRAGALRTDSCPAAVPVPPHVCTRRLSSPRLPLPALACAHRPRRAGCHRAPRTVPGVAWVPGLARCRCCQAPRSHVSLGSPGAAAEAALRAGCVCALLAGAWSLPDASGRATKRTGRSCVRGHGSAQGRRAASAPARPSRAFLLTRLQTPLRRATPRCPPQRARWLGAPHPCCAPAWVRTSSCRQLGLQRQEKIHEDFSGTKSVFWQNPTCPAFGDGGRRRLCAAPPSGEQLCGPQTEAAGQKAAAATVFLLGDTPLLPAPQGPSLLSLHCPP